MFILISWIIINSYKIHEALAARSLRSYSQSKRESADKPGSVLEGAERRPFICDIRHHMPVATYPEVNADNVLLQRNVLPYLVLLQVGFTVPSTLANAVRSYRTISPLP